MEQQELIRTIFGIKIKYHRQEKGLSYHELSDQTGLSPSYIHEIERGKKYPKPDKIVSLSEALGVDYDYLVTLKATKRLQPIIELLRSDFLKEFPLDEFGVDVHRVFDLFAETPDKLNAFISTIVKMVRTHQLSQEEFYMAALRAYQDLRDNYFEDIEKAVKEFVKREAPSSSRGFDSVSLEAALNTHFGIRVDRKTMSTHPTLEPLRSYYHPEKKVLFLNSGLRPEQVTFLLGRELGFHVLALTDRPYETRLLKAEGFDQLLNNFKASYFAVALLMKEEEVVRDLSSWLSLTKADESHWLKLIEKYRVTPEMLMQRITNVLSQHFGLTEFFFIRMHTDESLSHFVMTKELHLARQHTPHGNAKNEHYCRRWASVNILKRLRTRKGGGLLFEHQISAYQDPPDSYYCFSIAQHDFRNSLSSVTIGLMVNQPLLNTAKFLSDKSLKVRQVSTTCESCPIEDCNERVAPPVNLEKELSRKLLLDELKKL